MRGRALRIAVSPSQYSSAAIGLRLANFRAHRSGGRWCAINCCWDWLVTHRTDFRRLEYLGFGSCRTDSRADCWPHSTIRLRSRRAIGIRLRRFCVDRSIRPTPDGKRPPMLSRRRIDSPRRSVPVWRGFEKDAKARVCPKLVR
jgi:hypothetical protein